ncbi:hypothetical protein K501DRAFT_332616 [Backusella circina FSU 941]|nr:hypothetical protein K501DRAFT_332616 [Backusella circina FSU 941]
MNPMSSIEQQEEASNNIIISHRLESIKEESDTCPFTNTLLTQHDLLLATTQYHNHMETRCTTLLARLNNLPVLKSLTLRSYPLTLHDCELILRCKVLSSLFLLNITPLQETEPLDSDIQPTTSVTQLSIDLYERGEPRSNGWIFTYYNWNTYICKKFTHLVELHHRLYGHDYSNDFQRQQMFGSAYSILLETFPLQLKTLRVDSMSPPFAGIKLLDLFECHQLRTLELYFEKSHHDLFRILADSNQCKHLEELSIMHVPQVFEGLEDLIHLKALRVCGSEILFHHDTIPFLDLNNLLMHCPGSLASLLIHDCDILFDTDAAIQQFQYAYIKRLTLKNVYLAECFDTFILTCLPSLVSLRLIETNDIRILNLPNRHFRHVEITSSNTSHLSVTLRNDRQPRFYCCKRTKEGVVGLARLSEEMAPLRKRLEDIIDDVDEWIDLICGEIDDFVVDSMPVILGFT